MAAFWFTVFMFLLASGAAVVASMSPIDCDRECTTLYNEE